MINKSHDLNRPDSLQVTVDNQRVELPGWLANSMASIKTYLECIAMKKERVLWSLYINGIKVDPIEVAVPMDLVHQIQASTISFEELSDRLISAGRSKLNELTAEIEAAVLVVVINEWEAAQRLWQKWEPQLREPLFSLRALKELKENAFLGIDGKQALAERIEELGLIVCEIETLFRAENGGNPDMVVLSEILEFTLLPWLNSVTYQFESLEKRQRERML